MKWEEAQPNRKSQSSRNSGGKKGVPLRRDRQGEGDGGKSHSPKAISLKKKKKGGGD